MNTIVTASDVETQIEEMRGRIRRIDEDCGAIGRDPRSLRRSFLMVDAKAHTSDGLIGYYQSPKVFAAAAYVSIHYPERPIRVAYRTKADLKDLQNTRLSLPVHYTNGARSSRRTFVDSE